MNCKARISQRKRQSTTLSLYMSHYLLLYIHQHICSPPKSSCYVKRTPERQTRKMLQRDTTSRISLTLHGSHASLKPSLPSPSTPLFTYHHPHAAPRRNPCQSFHNHHPQPLPRHIYRAASLVSSIPYAFHPRHAAPIIYLTHAAVTRYTRRFLQ